MLEKRYWHVASRRVGKPRVGYLEDGVARNEPSKERATRYKFYDFHGTSRADRGVGVGKGVRGYSFDRAKTGRREEIGPKLGDERT